MRLLILLTLILATSSAVAFGPVTGRILRIVDGDTVEVDASLWPNIRYRGLVRLVGIDTPEKAAKAACERTAAVAAAKALERFVGRDAVIAGVRQDKYAGRVLGSVCVGFQCLSEAQVAAGHARRYSGQGPKAPWCTDNGSF